jgi:hypothetical protein
MIDNEDKLLEFINKNLKPKEAEKKQFGEVFTPLNLVNEMLDKLPDHVWTDKNLKWFEPASGMGNFAICVYLRLLKNLKPQFNNENKTKEHILKHMLYMSEINSKNVEVCKNIFGVDYLNIHHGDTLKLDIQKEWGVKKFDIIMGNPPYQVQVGPRNSQPIWNLFTKKYLDNLSINGYLLFVHPSGWRSPSGVFRDVFEKIMSKNLIYLNMNDFKKGRKVFNVGTNFDYYLVQNNNKKQPVEIVDIYDKKYTLDLSKWSFIPSGGFELYEKVLALNDEKKVDVLYSRSLYGADKVTILHDYSYELRKKWMSKTKSKDYKYPCCYTITMKDGMKCFYSSEKKGHFDIPKVIWSNGLGTYPIIDENGEYGLTQFSYAIIDNKENLDKIKRALENTDFIKLMEYVKFTDHKYNYKVIALLKKDFWKLFIESNNIQSLNGS